MNKLLIPIIIVSLVFSFSKKAYAQYESCEICSKEAWEGDSVAMNKFIMSCGIVDTVEFDANNEVIAPKETQKKEAILQTVTMKLNSGKVMYIDSIYFVVEKQPVFHGGDRGLLNYFKNELEYPKDAKNDGTSGTVFVNFIIEKDGGTSKAKVVRGVSGSCNAEAVRLINNMPEWIPGEHKGKTVRVQLTLPVKFALR